MFQDNNIWFFIFSVLPAIIYSLIIFRKSPKGSIKKKTMWSYILIGLLSIQVLKVIHFLFPHIHEYVETNLMIYKVGEFSQIVEVPTIWAIFVFAFLQVAFFEEISKWIAFRLGKSIRGDTRDGKDSPLAVMFYSAMISVGFAVFENIHYVGRVLWGDLSGMDIDPNQMLIARSLNSVVVHMVCGLFMGYFIAIGRRCKNIFKHAGYTLLGLLVATVFHGIYDFNLMKQPAPEEFVNVLGLNFHVQNNILIGLALLACYVMATKLSKISYKSGLMR